MKLNKILSLVLSCAVSVTALSVPAVFAADTEDRVIYEDNFDKYTGLAATAGNFIKRGNIFKEDSKFTTESNYTNYVFMTDENDETNKFIQLDAAYNTSHNQYHPTSMEFLPEEELLTKDNQMQKGKLKLGFSFRVDGVGETHKSNMYFRVTSAETMDYDLTNDRFTMFGVLAGYQNNELKFGIQLTEPNRTYQFIDGNTWYDVELVYDLLGNNVNTKVTVQADGTKLCSFDHKIDWYDPFKYIPVDNPEGSREYNAIRNILFKTTDGLKVSVDNFKLEYYLDKPEISLNDVIVTDYRGKVAENPEAVSPAVISIKLPFGATMSEDSTNPDTIVLEDSKGNEVPYTPEYSYDAYTLKLSNCLNTSETYKLRVPGSVKNIMGESLGRELIYTFKTTDKKPEFMAIESVKIGDADVTGLSDITNGATVDVCVEYANNSEKDIESFVSISYYNDGMLVHTESVKGETVGAGVMGAKTVPFEVPSADELKLDEVDRVSVCLWESFANSIAYVEAFEIGDTKEATEVTAKEPAVTYSYSKSTLNIQGMADKGSKFVTVQILKPDSSFENGDDGAVFYRGQTSVKDGAYSLDVRFDDKQNESSTLKSGMYPARIFVDGTKLDIDEVYINSYPDFAADCKALSDAAKNDDFAEFKRIINEERHKLNFVTGFAEDDDLDDEISAYFDYVKKNPIDANDEEENAEIFKTYVAIEYINDGKLDNVEAYIDELVLDTKVKELCSEMIYDDGVGKYFSELISGEDINGFGEFEDAVKEALILTTAKYGNGYGDLKKVLTECGDAIGISSNISTTACKALMGKTFDDGDDFKKAYKDNASSPSGGSSSGGGGSSSGGGRGGNTSLGVNSVKLETVEKEELVPVTKEFNDIDNYEWATESILGLADLGIINGVSETKFAPSLNVLREEFAKIITGALGMADYEYGDNIFKDAADADWFTPYINIAADLGVAKGIGDGYFGVGENIKRQDMAVMIYNALLYRGVDMVSGDLKFADSGEIADYAKTAVSALYNMGAINGVSETEFAPNNYATRAEAAKMVYGVLEQLQR